MRMKQWRGGLVVIAILSAGGCSGGQPPASLGVNQGQLAPCPDSPNCVSSQAADENRWVHPLRYQGERARARAQLLAVLDGMDRAEIVQADENYIHAQFRSAVFGFVDDVEFLFDSPGFIQVRSAARIGYYDFGVNRERVERIRVRFTEAMEES
ncbi:MAG: DUF1499 domain-containing protein [Candidatus Competibacter sp.]|nr:DUF1499 domain-containing protein [Candidatus Competibacter sp.]